MRITAEQVQRFARKSSGSWFRTLKQNRRFQLLWSESEITYIPETGGAGMGDKPAYIQRWVDLFNEHQDFKTTHYKKGVTASYFIAVVKAMLTSGENASVLPPEMVEALADTAGAPETERAELILSRIGQGKFRRDLIELCRECYVTGIDDERLLRASHIKPWRDSSNSERLDPRNGMLLTPTLDLLFDKGLISFADDGQMLVTHNVNARALETLGVDPRFRGKPFNRRTCAYLAYHRNYVLQ
jgi:hypothetical protein